MIFNKFDNNLYVELTLKEIKLIHKGFGLFSDTIY
ncbi:hypothetical protein SAMN05444353_2752 [Polaribacter dokdonensis DSW-5]|uniref:Uncharacterized protein n=1 Tax=Polaribacter dokdonensis DSW-5 TaxID=1300348 RepID=A0A1H5KCZ8_9FLAO|nr:hypothetical protein SAMN05444353_2752 [Polaribacter dokdonensis DSW-5]